MPNRPYNPKQGWLLPYAIRPLPPEREAAIAAMIAAEDASDAENADPRPSAATRPA